MGPSLRCIDDGIATHGAGGLIASETPLVHRTCVVAVRLCQPTVQGGFVNGSRKVGTVTKPAAVQSDSAPLVLRPTMFGTTQNADVGTGVGTGVGAGVGTGVGRGVGLGVGFGVGPGSEVGTGV